MALCEVPKTWESMVRAETLSAGRISSTGYGFAEQSDFERIFDTLDDYFSLAT